MKYIVPSLFDCYLLRLGESCSHIGAILFKIEAAICLGYNKQAYIDVVCKWNNDFVKKIEGKEIGDIIFYKTKTCKQKPVLDVSGSERQQRLFLQRLTQIPVKKLPVPSSLFKDYSEPFVFRKPVPSNTKIPNYLREFYKPNISKEEIFENIQKIMDIRLTGVFRLISLKMPPSNKAILFYGKTCVLVELQPPLSMMFYIQT